MTLGTRIWSTEAVQPAQRFDYWVGAICECFLEMDADSGRRQDFSAQLESQDLAELRLNRVTGSAQQVFRTRGAISRSDCNYYYLLCKQATPCNVIQCDLGQARLLPGDLVLIDSRRCYELHFPERVDTLSLQIPISWLDAWLPNTRALLGQRIDGSSGWGAVLGAYLRQVATAAPILPAAQHRDHLGGLIAATFSQGRLEASQADADDALVNRIDALVAAHFAEPGLGAAEVAARLGISVRTLYRVLARQGMSFSALLNQHRIAAARRMLASPGCRLLSIAEIGRRAGWLDASHFSRAWQACTGQRPSQTRQQMAREH
ncbi:helix-turn-helix domain-containing protein [Herbaspirillum sp. B65]|jgi:AraC-like DNA-binding protein|uniref:helix-turn-helix domain-containing protein n=1 Tax=Herbaspirillum sp. B65 TaxID=137708 RepID=UPI00034ABF29|nr:helix-turn-helix domain-containing protein [Herbaspirillum sp. B65]